MDRLQQTKAAATTRPLGSRSKGASANAVVVTDVSAPGRGKGGRPGPTRLHAVLQVDAPLLVPASGGTTSTQAFANGARLRLSCFDVDDGLQFGDLVRLCGLSVRVKGSATYVNVKRIARVDAHPTKHLLQLPARAFFLPKPVDVLADATSNSTNVLVRFRAGDPPVVDDAVRAHAQTLVTPSHRDGFTHDGADGEASLALKTTLAYYQWDEDAPDGRATPLALSLRLFDSHLTGLGITDVDAWRALAPGLLRALDGVVPAYVDHRATGELDVNQGFGSPGFDGGLVVKAKRNEARWDLDAVLAAAAFEVSREFATTRVACQPTANALNDDDASPHLNLSEYGGAIDALVDGTRFFLLANVDGDDDDREALRLLSVSERERCFDKVPGCATRVRYVDGARRWVFYARTPDVVVGAKRPR